MKKIMVLLCGFIFSFSAQSQDGFQFDPGKSKAVVPFQLVNNLIFIPINVNGVELNFLLDSGIEETLLFSLEDQDEVSFNNVASIRLQGLGGAESIEGLKSSNNKLVLDGLSDSNHNIYIVLDQEFNFSSEIGIPVNGIIGYQFFKDHLVEINYDRKKITVYKDQRKIRKRIEKKFTAIPITLELKKPYTTATVVQGQNDIMAKLLIDTGSSDAIWLFKNKSNALRIPEKNFEDFLGRGFSGDIYGKRGRISKLSLASFDFPNPIAAFPDSSSIKNIQLVANRLGSVGGEILKRFTIIFDYKNNTIFLKKGHNYNLPFHYNMSGIELHHSGLRWVQETVPLQTIPMSVELDASGEKRPSDFRYKFELKPIYTISNLRAGSPAERCGLQKDDVIIKINNIQSYRYTLQQINSLLKSEEGKIIKLEVERNNQVREFTFQLKSLL